MTELSEIPRYTPRSPEELPIPEGASRDEIVMELIRRTWNGPYMQVRELSHGRRMLARDEALLRPNVEEVDEMDGIGTKTEIHWKHGTLWKGAIDALAMNLNDVVRVGATPYRAQVGIEVPDGPDSDSQVIGAMAVLSQECRYRGIAITGGETADKDTIDAPEILIAATGFVEREKVIDAPCRPGDILVGIGSYGLHSNGYTLVRRVLGDEAFDPDLAQELTEPTLIYSEEVLDLVDDPDIAIRRLDHVTGRAYEKLGENLLDPDIDIRIHRHSLKPQPIFEKLFERGISSAQMYREFNNGVGFVAVLDRDSVEAAVTALRKRGLRAAVIGEVREGDGTLRVESAYDGQVVTFPKR